jgi:hypothetical protein
LKDQTTKWIEDVNKSFDDLQPKLADNNVSDRSTNQNKSKHRSSNKVCEHAQLVVEA